MSITRIAFVVLLVTLPGGAVAGQTKHYDFRVFLDDKDIGHHRFSVSSVDARTHVTSEARFDVKFLFMTVYEYLHSNSEVWEQDCLRTIRATTDDNGETLSVAGQYRDDHLLLETPVGQQKLEGCIRTFAYWDPDLLTSGRLLNPQTGEIVPVSIEPLGESTVDVRGERVPARRLRLNNHEFAIDLWYSADEEWLALESTTENGRRLRYLLR
jgi:hypothetical protein